MRIENIENLKFEISGTETGKMPVLHYAEMSAINV
jgi:hypothetical protein